jgi:hypothetical protein
VSQMAGIQFGKYLQSARGELMSTEHTVAMGGKLSIHISSRASRARGSLFCIISQSAFCR